MDNDRIREQIYKINNYGRKNPWIDFEIEQYSNGRLIIQGSIDLLIKIELKITFIDIFFVSLPFEWKTDTKEDFLYLIEGDEAKHINLKFQVEQGYNIFKFIPEYYSNNFGCYIGAKDIIFETPSAFKDEKPHQPEKQI